MMLQQVVSRWSRHAVLLMLLLVCVQSMRTVGAMRKDVLANDTNSPIIAPEVKTQDASTKVGSDTIAPEVRTQDASTEVGSEILQQTDQLGCTFCPESPFRDTFSCYQDQAGLRADNMRFLGTDSSMIEDIRTFKSSRELSASLDMQKLSSLVTGAAGTILSSILDGGLDFVWKNGHQLLQAKLTVPVKRVVVAHPEKLLPATVLSTIETASSDPLDADAALDFAVEYGTHMVTEVTLGGQLTMLREVEESSMGGKLGFAGNMFSLNTDSAGMWSHVDVRGGNPSLLNAKTKANDTDDLVDAIKAWADSVRSDTQGQVIVEQVVTPLYQVLPREKTQEREWLRGTFEEATLSLRGVRQDQVTITALANSVSDLMQALPSSPKTDTLTMADLQQYSTFTKKVARLCSSVRRAEDKGASTPFRRFAEQCQQAAYAAWNILVPAISGGTPKSFPALSKAMSIVDTCGKQMNWHPWQAEPLKTATCNIAKKALFCRHWYSCWRRYIKCIPAVGPKGHDACKCFHPEASTRDARIVSKCDSRYAALGNDEWTCQTVENVGCVCQSKVSAQSAPASTDDPKVPV